MNRSETHFIQHAAGGDAGVASRASTAASRIEVRIDRVVVEGFADMQPEALTLAIEQALEQDLVEITGRAVPDAKSERRLIHNASVARTSGTIEIAHHIARAVVGEVWR
jgi:hypothetical protein